MFQLSGFWYEGWRGTGFRMFNVGVWGALGLGPFFIRVGGVYYKGLGFRV